MKGPYVQGYFWGAENILEVDQASQNHCLFFPVYLFDALRGLGDLSSSFQDWIQAVGSESEESWLLDSQGVPHGGLLVAPCGGNFAQDSTVKPEGLSTALTQITPF